MLTFSFLIAAAVNGLVMNPAYQYLLMKFKLNFKPFNCVYCLSFWIGLLSIPFLASTHHYNYTLVLIPLAASFIAVCLDRWLNNQPVTFK